MKIYNTLKSLYYWFLPISPNKNHLDVLYEGRKIGFADKIKLTHNYFTIINVLYLFESEVKNLFTNHNCNYANQHEPLILRITDPYLGGITYKNVWITSVRNSYKSGAILVVENVCFKSDKPILISDSIFMKDYLK